MVAGSFSVDAVLGGGGGVAWGCRIVIRESVHLGLTYLPFPSQNLLPAPVVLASVHELDLFR